jgi:hypothetical protein
MEMDEYHPEERDSSQDVERDDAIRTERRDNLTGARANASIGISILTRD